MTQQPNGNFLADFVESYVVGAATAEAHQYVRVYLPNPDDFPMPAGGYPVLMGSTAGGFVTTGPAPLIPYTSPALLAYRVLTELGIAVVGVGMTGTYLDQSGTLNTTSPGRGIFHPPGTAGWEDELRYSAQKEAVLAVQLVRERAATWGLDPDRIVVEGGSSGGGAFSAPAFWPEQADPSKSDHRRQSSRVRGMRLRIPQTDWKLYDPTEPAPANFNCFPDAGGDLTADLCPTFGDAPVAPVDYLRWASPMRIGLDTAQARVAVAEGFSLWLQSHEGGMNVADLALEGDWTATTGKQSVEVGTVDPVTTEARHEAAHSLHLFRALVETQAGLYHTRTSRLVLDQATYDYAVAADPYFGDLVHEIRDFDILDQDLQDLELAWLAEVLLDQPAPPAVQDLPRVQLGSVVDVSLATSTRGIDLVFFQSDLGRERSLRSMIVASLFSDARAPADLDDLPDGSSDRRGFWGNDARGELGSLLWLHTRSKAGASTAEKLRGAVLDALGWMLEAGIASSVEAAVTATGPTTRIAITLKRGERARWSAAWDALDETPIEGPGFLVTIGT